MPQTVSFRVISARKHVKGQPLYDCLTLHNGIWKTIKRKINSQINIWQIVKLNDKCYKNKRLVPIFWKFEIRKISKHPRLHFLQMSGCITVLVIHYNIHCINSFHTMHMRAAKSLVSLMFIQCLHGLWLHSTHLASKQSFWVKISCKIYFKGHTARKLSCRFLTE